MAKYGYNVSVFSPDIAPTMGGGWKNVERYELTDSEIRGIYSAQILYRVTNPVGPKFRLMSDTPSFYIPLSTESGYNSLLPDLTAISRILDSKAMYHIVNLNAGQIEIMYDNDIFTGIVSNYGNRNYGVKVVASNIDEFMDGFILYHRLMHKYSDIVIQPSFELLMYTGEWKFYPTIYSWLLMSLPSPIQDKIISYAAYEFFYVNKHSYLISKLFYNVCEFAPWHKVLDQTLKRTLALMPDSKILDILPRNPSLWTDPLILLRIFIPYYPNAFKYVLSRINLDNRSRAILINNIIWNVTPKKESPLSIPTPDKELILNNTALALKALLERVTLTNEEIEALFNTWNPNIIDVLNDYGYLVQEK